MKRGALDDLTGRRFGRFVVVSRAANDKQGKPQWNCVCVCGNQRVVRSTPLRQGKSLSCGCLARELTISRTITHGMSKSGEYKSWRHMKQRCLEVENEHYKYYGARGITICERWADSFENFLADMGPRPSPSHSIDRIDPLGNYEPDNCRWATLREQNRNKTSNVRITAFGRTQLAADWAREIGIAQTTLSDRLARGVPVELAVSVRRLGGKRG